MRGLQVARECGLAGAEPPKEPALEQVLLAGRARGHDDAGRALIREQPLEDVDRAVERRAQGAVLAPAAPAAVLEPLAREPGDDRCHVDAEIGAIGHRATVDALLDLAVPEPLVVMLPARVGADQRDHPPRSLARWVQAELAQEVEHVGSRRPRLSLRLPLTLGEPARKERAARPLTVLVLTRQQPRAPTLGLHPGAFGAPLGLRRAEKVAHDLPADRRIGCEQPVDQRNPTTESGSPLREPQRRRAVGCRAWLP